MKMDRTFRQRWLKSIGLIFAVFGLLMAVFGGSDLFRVLFGPIVDAVFWEEGPGPEAAAFQRWVYGTWGGTVAGFGMIIAVCAKSALVPENKPLRHGILFSLTLWFIVDTGSSIVFGVWGNALFINLPGYLALAAPLLLGKSDQNLDEWPPG
jgi:hypothetical protein